MIAATITVTTTATDLFTLLTTAGYSRPQEGFEEIRVESNLTNTNPVFIGDARVTNAIYAASIPAGYTATVASGQGPWVIQFGQGANSNDLNTRTLFFVSTGGTQTVHIWIR